VGGEKKKKDILYVRVAKKKKKKSLNAHLHGGGCEKKGQGEKRKKDKGTPRPPLEKGKGKKTIVAYPILQPIQRHKGSFEDGLGGKKKGKGSIQLFVEKRKKRGKEKGRTLASALCAPLTRRKKK